MRKHSRVWTAFIVSLCLFSFSTTLISCGSSKNPAIAKSKGGQAISSIIFSPDGDRIAYVEVPKFLLFGSEALTQLSDKPEGESWLVVKPLSGKPEKICKLGDGSKTVRIQWRSGTEEIILEGMDLLGKGHTKESIYVASTKSRALETLVDGKDFSVSPDGGKLAFVRTIYTSGSGNEGLFILNLDSGRDFKISDLECKHPRWSNSAGELVFSGILASGAKRYKYTKQRKMDWYYGDIYIYDVNSGRVRQITDNGIFNNPDFTPDGGKIAASSWDAVPGTRKKSLSLIDKSTGSWEVLLKPCELYNDFYKYDFTTNTGELIFEGTFKNLNIRGSKSRKTLKSEEKSTATTLFRIRLDGNDLKRLDLNGHEFIESPVFSPNGDIFTYRIEYADYNTEFFSVRSSKM